MKFITTGNPETGLASGIAKVLDSDFCSRTNGWDLNNEDTQDKFVKYTNLYDGVILNAHTLVGNLAYVQARLMHKIYVNWQDQGRTGHLIGIGSITDHINTEQPWIKYISYRAEKVALENICQTINHNRANISPGIKCSYISVGHMHTPYVDKLHPKEKKLTVEEVAQCIKYIVESPMCIEEITLTADRSSENG